MRCDDVGEYLRDKLRLPSDAPVAINIDGTMQSESRGKRIAAILHDAGFRRVATVGFITEPNDRAR